MALSKSEKQLIKQRTMAKRIKSAKRFVGKNLWRAARIKSVGSDGRRDDERYRRFQFCLKVLEEA